MLKNIFCFILVLLLHFSVLGQNKLFLTLHSDLKKSEHNNTILLDSSIIQSEIKSYLSNLHNQGYLLATVDTVFFSGDTISAFISVGKKFYWISLSPGNVNEFFLTKAGFREKFFRQKTFLYTEVAKLEKGIVDYAENNGYPFAEVRLDSLLFKDQKLSASLNYDSGPLVFFDSVEINGVTKTKSRFIQRYLGIIPGNLFDQRKMGRVEMELQKLGYVALTRPPYVIFRDNKARLVLNLQDSKANYVDGLVGILPNEGKNKKVLFTGEANILLQNIFGTGKKVKIEWKKYDQESQLLDFNYFHPVLLGTSVNLDFKFNLLKQDSTFLNLDRSLTLSQSLNNFGTIGLFGNYKTSRSLLESETTKNKDFNYIQYGVYYSFDWLDNIFLPKRGWRVDLMFSAGNKNLKNLERQKSDFEGEKSSTQFSSSFGLERYTAFGKRSTLLSKVTGGGVFNDKGNLYTSDLYRLGGLASLRGFNEKYFYAEIFLTATLEYRLFLESTTYFMIFVDQGYIKNSLNDRLREDYPTGIGAGLSFTSGPGIFTFIYSLGRTIEQPFAFNLSKIHFGFTSRF